MPRPRTKEELLLAAEENCDKLMQLIDGMSEKERNTPFDFSADEKKREAHWSRDKNLRDVLIHLYEWQQLLLNKAGGELHTDSPFLPKPYNWKSYGDMNRELWKKHQSTSEEEAMKLFKQSHKDVMELIKSFSNDELFGRGVYKWVGTTNLGSYCISTTSAHYMWAQKKLKAHKKNCQ